MIQPNNKVIKRRYKILIVAFLLSILIVSTGASRIMLSFFYLKNGDSITINNYKIEFPFSHWAYFGESGITYVVAGKDIGIHNLSAEFFKDTKDIDISKVTANCDKMVEKDYKSSELAGTIYLCARKDNETMYFQSGDQEIFIREDDFNSSIPEIVKEYKLLLDNISLQK